MKGMWTKQLTNEGKIFYYNSSLNKSLWTAPLDAILHEAENLTPLHIPEQGEISEYVEITQNVQNNNHAVRMAGVNSSVVQINVQSLDAKTTEDRMQEAVAKKQREIVNKRAKTDNSTNQTTESNSYLLQKSEYENMAGAKGTDSSKWLVR